MSIQELPRQIQVIFSYLDDVGVEIGKIKAIGLPHLAESRLDELINGGALSLAIHQLERARMAGLDVDWVESAAHHVTGNLYLAVADTYLDNNGKSKNSTANTKWLTMAADEYEAAIEGFPMPESALELGRIYLVLGSWEKAIDAFQQAEAGDDDEVSIKATKYLHRITT